MRFGGIMRRTGVYAALMITAMMVGLLGAPPAQAEKRSILSLLRTLTIAPESGTGYDRKLFPHWDYLGDDCDVRDALLIAEARRGPVTGDACPVGAGRWFSAFDGVTVRDPSELDVDHLVPLAEAWGSGARTWSTSVRERFANDLGYAKSLIAVTASSNRSKGDQDPAEWLPPRTAYRCTYISSWIGVKYRWRLTVDAREEAALRVLATNCGDPTMVVPERAR